MVSWLLIDCALQTTAILVEQTSSEYKVVARGESPTTIHTEGDVTLGVIEAIGQIEAKLERTLFKDGIGILRTSAGEGQGVDHVLVTSSVGGGLQMMVAGLVRIMTAASAERAALGAGANVLDVLAIDDGRFAHERIERMRQLKPDMFLFSGGVDAGNEDDVLQVAREIAQADLVNTPVVYAGNIALREQIHEILDGRYQLSVVENVRPVLEDEVLEPTRKRIHELFMEHVVSKAPGFSELAAWADRPIMPSTGAVSQLIEVSGELGKINVLAVTIGDATTDVFSTFGGRFTRTVTADLGLGRGIANVAVKAGHERMFSQVPGEQEQLMNRLYNLMLEPIEAPEDTTDQALHEAAAREAMRIAIAEHSQRATGLRGVQMKRDISNVFDQHSTGESLVKPMDLNLLIAGASVFRWSPAQRAAELLLEALPLAGITHLALDKLAISPHLGMLATVDPAVAYELYLQDGLEHLGVAICPVGRLEVGAPCLKITVRTSTGAEQVETYRCGQLHFLPVPAGSELVIEPTANFDVGAGRGQQQILTMRATSLGLIIDTRKKVQV